ncbi:MAG: toxin-activating lysine-acyltransferase [Nitrospirales bacterium]
MDKKLEAQQKAKIPFRFTPQDWKSGEIPWLLAVLAPKEVAQALVKKLEDTVFKDKTHKQFTLRPTGVGPQNLATDNEEKSRTLKATEP